MCSMTMMSRYSLVDQQLPFVDGYSLSDLKLRAASMAECSYLMNVDVDDDELFLTGYLELLFSIFSMSSG